MTALESPTAYKASPSRARFTSTAPKCSTCNQTVYFAEKVTGPGQKQYHKFCLKCTQCNKILDALALLEHDGDPFCKSCHMKLFGPKGFGFGGSMGGDYIDRLTGSRSPSVSPTKAPMTTVDPSAWSPSYSPSSLPPAMARKESMPGTPPESPLKSYLNATAMDRTTSASSNSSSTSRVSASGNVAASIAALSKAANEVDKCKRCDKTVYFAERVMAAGHKWHRGCLRCEKCSRTLDSHMHVGKDNLPYCRKCSSEMVGLGSMGIMTRPGLY